MDSDSLPRKAAALTWADLPPKALAIISSRLRKPVQIVRVRSVCKSWRSSVPPNRHKFSFYYPSTSTLLGLGEPREPTFDVTFYASAIYLVRPHSDPTYRFMVYAREIAPGNLILCHPLTYQEIKTTIDPSSSTKLMAIANVHSETCVDCKGLVGMSNAVIIREIWESSSIKLGLVGLCARKDFTVKHLFACTLGWGLVSDGTATATAETSAKPLLVGKDECSCDFVSYVKFEELMFAVDRRGHIYVMRAKTWDLVEIGILRDAEEHARKDFVVFNGGLFLISTLYNEYCRTYRLSVDESSLEKIIHDRSGHIVMEQVDNVGEGRVVFIGAAFSFSVAARYLPRPWKGNCVVYLKVHSSVCGCAAECDVEPEAERIMVVDIARRGADEITLKFNKISELKAIQTCLKSPQQSKLIQCRIQHHRRTPRPRFWRFQNLPSPASRPSLRSLTTLREFAMDSDSLPQKAAAFTWADLPPKVLAIISSKLRKYEQIELRSVCKSWLSSIPPNRHKFNPYFPFTSSLLGLGQPREPTFDVTVSTSAVYLALPHCRASRFWLVCVREVSPGNLILCHPLTYQEIKFPTSDAVDPYSASMAVSAIVARSFVHNEICIDCKGLVGISNVSFVGKSPWTKLGVIGLSARKDFPAKHLFGFTYELISQEETASNSPITTTAKPLLVGDNKCCCDVVSYVLFKGFMFSVDRRGHIFVLRPKKMELFEISILRDSEQAKKDFVISSGELYLISTLNGVYCRIYKLSVDKDSLNKIIRDRNGQIVMEQVANVGNGRVAFIGMACSFAIPYRFLPPPWKGNRVVYLDVVGSSMCGCKGSAAAAEPQQIMVVQLARSIADESSVKFNNILELEGYSDVFSPPFTAPIGVGTLPRCVYKPLRHYLRGGVN